MKRKGTIGVILSWWMGVAVTLACFLPAGELMAGGNGFIEVAPSGRYFQHRDGTPFFPVGIHGHDMIDQAMGRLYWEAYFKLMNQSGINVLRLLMDGASSNGVVADPDYWFEANDADNPVPACGDAFAGGCDLSCEPAYNPAVEETLSYLFYLAEKYKVYL